jgi:hypothetical protein
MSGAFVSRGSGPSFCAMTRRWRAVTGAAASKRISRTIGRRPVGSTASGTSSSVYQRLPSSDPAKRTWRGSRIATRIDLFLSEKNPRP